MKFFPQTVLQLRGKTLHHELWTLGVIQLQGKAGKFHREEIVKYRGSPYDSKGAWAASSKELGETSEKYHTYLSCSLHAPQTNLSLAH